jgi:hypothetical protein
MYACKIIATTIIALSLFSQEHKTKAKAAQQSPTPDQRGTQQSPLIVKTLKPPQTDEEIKREEEERKNKSENDRDTVKLTRALALIALGQLVVYAYQAVKLRQTVKSAGEQSKAMERHIGEASRSADAMELIANTIAEGNRDILRAYLTVTIGSALYQERREGQENLKFEAKPNLVHTGNTPARKICIRISADILPIPVPEDFAFPLPPVEVEDAGTIGAHQSYILGGTVKDFVPYGDVPAIKEGKEKALCVWGLITYEDVFGKAHKTKFGQWITWWPNDQIIGYYLAGQNDAD